MKIGIISDTHNLLREEVLTRLSDCQAILHAGDVSRPEILDRLLAIAPLYVVRGNNDRDWAEDIPLTRAFTLEGVSFFMVHKRKDLPADLPACDVIILGHTHRYDQDLLPGGTLVLNPGSCGPRRFGRPATMAEMVLEGGKVKKVEKIDLPDKEGGKVRSEATLRERTDLTTAMIVKAMGMVERGRSVREIAARLGISEALSEEICRMILTHPGVAPEGVMRRLGL